LTVNPQGIYGGIIVIVDKSYFSQLSLKGKRVIYRPSIHLFGIALLLGMFGHTHAASLAEPFVGLSINSIDDGNLAVSGNSLFLRRTLVEEELSAKVSVQEISIENSSQYQIDDSPVYKETQSHLSAGVDYIYFDSSVLLNTHYAQIENGSTFDIYLELGQELKNGISSIQLGIGQGWEDDSSLNLHNKSRSLNINYNRYLKAQWAIQLGFELGSSNGDLINFQDARRFNDINRTRVPSSRTDRKIILGSSHDLGNSRFIEVKANILTNDWEQNGNSIGFNYLKQQSTQFSYNLYFNKLSRDRSLYYSGNLIDTANDIFTTDAIQHAQLKRREMGFAIHYTFKGKLSETFYSPKIGIWVSEIKNEYFLPNKATHSGQLTQLNLSTRY